MRWSGLIVLFIAALSLMACGEVPKDPDDSLATIRERGVLRVAVAHNPPWTNIRTSPYEGSEVQAAQAFAGQLDVTATYSAVSLQDGMKGLEVGEFDLLIAGLTKASPYRKVGFTRAYQVTTAPTGEEMRHVMAVPLGENRLLVTLERFLKEHASRTAEQGS